MVCVVIGFNCSMFGHNAPNLLLTRSCGFSACWVLQSCTGVPTLIFPYILLTGDYIEPGAALLLHHLELAGKAAAMEKMQEGRERGVAAGIVYVSCCDLEFLSQSRTCLQYCCCQSSGVKSHSRSKKWAKVHYCTVLVVSSAYLMCNARIYSEG